MDKLTSEDKQLVAKVSQWFLENKKTLSLAESLTGGLISSWITTQSGVSSFYKGAVVSYSEEVKKSSLNVSDFTLNEFGVVSAPVSEQMAKGVRKTLNTDWAISVTGLAGPEGGDKNTPVGTVFISLVGPKFERTEKKYFEPSDGREIIQEKVARLALQLLLEHIH